MKRVNNDCLECVKKDKKIQKLRKDIARHIEERFEEGDICSKCSFLLYTDEPYKVCNRHTDEPICMKCTIKLEKKGELQRCPGVGMKWEIK